jgi:hypothetical protein
MLMQDIIEIQGYKLLILDENRFCYKAMVLNSELTSTYTNIVEECDYWFKTFPLKNMVTELREVNNTPLYGGYRSGRAGLCLPLSFDEYRKYQDIIVKYDKRIQTLLFTSWTDKEGAIMLKGGITHIGRDSVVPVAPIIMISKDALLLSSASTEALIEELRKRVL